jgi:hypothetical protein
MARATDAQVQQFVNERVRPRAEQIRALLNAMEDDISAIGDVYAHLNDNPTWEDNRTDAPPYLLSASDVLNINTFLSDITTAINGHAQLSVTMKACVSPVGA